MYDIGMKEGALGGKILGAGGGGFLCFLCNPINQPALKMALKDFKEYPFSFEPYGSRVTCFA